MDKIYDSMERDEILRSKRGLVDLSVLFGHGVVHPKSS
jgi:hypothetical protein